jgi:hypothetical protein
MKKSFSPTVMAAIDFLVIFAIGAFFAFFADDPSNCFENYLTMAALVHVLFVKWEITFNKD